MSAPSVQLARAHPRPTRPAGGRAPGRRSLGSLLNLQPELAARLLVATVAADRLLAARDRHHWIVALRTRLIVRRQRIAHALAPRRRARRRAPRAAAATRMISPA